MLRIVMNELRLGVLIVFLPIVAVLMSGAVLAPYLLLRLS